MKGLLFVMKALVEAGNRLGPWVLPWLVLGALAAGALRPNAANAQGFGHQPVFVAPPPPSQVLQLPPVYIPPPLPPIMTPSFQAMQRDTQVRSQMESMQFHQHVRQMENDRVAAVRAAELAAGAATERALKAAESRRIDVPRINAKASLRFDIPANPHVAARISAAQFELGRQFESAGNLKAAMRCYAYAAKVSPSRSAQKAVVRLQRLRAR